MMHTLLNTGRAETGRTAHARRGRRVLGTGRRRFEHAVEAPTVALALIAPALVALWLLVVPADREHLAALLPCAPLVACASGPTEPARVATVIDGDTLVLEDGRTVRLLGIDTPETVHPDMDGPQPYGLAASERLRMLVEGRHVRLERDVSDVDHFGRTLRHVWQGRTLVAERLLREGLGHAQAIPPDTRHAARLRDAERAAREAGRGLWSVPRPTSLPIFGRRGRGP